MASEDEVKEVLKKVIDPDVGYNIVDLGLIYEIKMTEKVGGKDTRRVSRHPSGVGRQKVEIKMTLTTPFCPYAPQIIEQVKQQASSIDGVDSVEVEVIWDPPWDKSKMSEEAKLALGLV